MASGIEKLLLKLRGIDSIDFVNEILIGCLPSDEEIILTESASIVDEIFVSKYITINQIRLHGVAELIFDHCTFKTLEIRNIIGRGIHLSNCQIEVLLLHGTIGRIEISGGYISKLQVLPCSINTLVIGGQNETTILGSVDASSDFINTIQYFNVISDNIVIARKRNEERRLELNRVTVNNLEFQSVRYGIGIKINTIKPRNQFKSIVTFKNSILQNVRFQNSDFSKFKHLIVINSTLEGLISEYVVWFKSIIKEDNSEDFLAYRQLKGTLRHQNDFIGATYFRAKEQNAYLKSLRGSKRYGEQIMLFLNKISNNHGVSWTRGLLFTFLVSLFWFVLYLLSFEQIPNDWLRTILTNYNKYIEYFSQFFIVTHSFDFIKDFGKQTGLSYIIDIFSRVFIGYGIYQTVQAFRKYGKD